MSDLGSIVRRRPLPSSANGSTPSISNVGEPCMRHRAASSSSEITWCDIETPARPPRTVASRSSRTGAFGQPGTARTVRCIHPAPVAWLPGQVPVEPLQRRPDHRALMPAARHDLPANRLGGTAQRLAHHRGLMVPCLPPQKMDTADADAYLGMAAVPTGSRILDVGCGDGGLVHRLAELGFNVAGVDPAAPSHQRLVPVRVGDAQLLGKFDAVAAVMALHHADLDAVVRALANLLRPRGSVFIYEFSWDAYDGRAAAWLAKHDLSPTDNSVAGWRREHSELHTTATIKTPTAGSGEGYPHFRPHTGCRKPNLAHPGLDGQRLHVWAVSAGRRLFLGARLRVYDQGADLRVLIVSRRNGSAASDRTRPGFGCLEGKLLLAERTKAGG